MASLTGALALINTKIPDNTTGFVTPAKVREVLFYLSVLADQASGGSGNYTPVTIDDDSAGTTYTIEGATTSLQVVKNGVTLMSGYSFNSGTGTWTFSEPLIEDDELLFIWS